jgi:hypothetical protein
MKTATKWPLGKKVLIRSEGKVVSARVTRVRGDMRIVSWGNGHCATFYVGADGKIGQR